MLTHVHCYGSGPGAEQFANAACGVMPKLQVRLTGPRLEFAQAAHRPCGVVPSCLNFALMLLTMRARRSRQQHRQ